MARRGRAHPFLPRCLSLPDPRAPSTPPHLQAPLSSRLKNLTQKNSFWIHRVKCLGTESHLANCQVQVAPAQGRLQPACLGGMHAVVSCTAEHKKSRAEVSPTAWQQEWVSGTGREGHSGTGRSGRTNRPHRGGLGADWEEESET